MRILSFFTEVCNFTTYLTTCRPIDFLGIDHDRLSAMFVFGAATGSVIRLVFSDLNESGNSWEKGIYNAYVSNFRST